MPISVTFVADPHSRFDEIRNLVSAYFDATVKETLIYGRETVDSFVYGLVWYVVYCVALYLALGQWRVAPCRGRWLLRSARRVMFVIAHPDDECMFFGPAIMRFSEQKACELYLLCLSKGIVLSLIGEHQHLRIQCADFVLVTIISVCCRKL